jgi:hypothetical protein
LRKAEPSVNRAFTAFFGWIELQHGESVSCSIGFPVDLLQAALAGSFRLLPLANC